MKITGAAHVRRLRCHDGSQRSAFFMRVTLPRRREVSSRSPKPQSGNSSASAIHLQPVQPRAEPPVEQSILLLCLLYVAVDVISTTTLPFAPTFGSSSAAAMSPVRRS